MNNTSTATITYCQQPLLIQHLTNKTQLYTPKVSCFCFVCSTIANNREKFSKVIYRVVMSFKLAKYSKVNIFHLDLYLFYLLSIHLVKRARESFFLWVKAIHICISIITGNSSWTSYLYSLNSCIRRNIPLSSLKFRNKSNFWIVPTNPKLKITLVFSEALSK